MAAERSEKVQPPDPMCFWCDNPLLPCAYPHQAFPLCDDDGVVRKGAMHDGTDYLCTGHAHFGGFHILCTSPAHDKPWCAACDGFSLVRHTCGQAEHPGSSAQGAGA